MALSGLAYLLALLVIDRQRMTADVRWFLEKIRV
jgi:hypothetical protein